MSSVERIGQGAGGLRAGDRVELALESWGRLGEAMARHEGVPVFVFGGIPGERVVGEVVRVHRKYVSAAVVEVLEAVSGRVEPPCRYFGECTGCQWQHLDYEAQLVAKREKVVDALVRVGGLFSGAGDVGVADGVAAAAGTAAADDGLGLGGSGSVGASAAAGDGAADAVGAGGVAAGDGPGLGGSGLADAAVAGADAVVGDTLPSDRRYGYRNHARFTVNRGGELGFVNRETRRFVRVDYCMLMRDGVNAVLEQLQDRCQETTQLSVRGGAGAVDSRFRGNDGGLLVGGGAGGSVGGGVGGSVGAGIGDSVGVGVGGSVGGGVGESVGAGAGDSVGAGTGDSVGAGAGESVGAGVGDSAGAGAGGLAGAGAGDSAGAGAGDLAGAGAGDSVRGWAGGSAGGGVGDSAGAGVGGSVGGGVGESVGAGGDGGYLVQPRLFSPGVGVVTGQRRYVESVPFPEGGESRFFVSSPSFFQVNVEQAARAAAVVRDGLDLGPEDVLLDAYTGVGTFAVLLAPYVGRVVAVEESAAAVADARENVRQNAGVVAVEESAAAVADARENVGQNAGAGAVEESAAVADARENVGQNAGAGVVEESAAAVADARENVGRNAAGGAVEFVLGRTEKVLGELAVRPDAVVLDPPRSGCQPQALEKLLELAPGRVAYVSCDPETLARDLKVLCRGGYALRRVVPIDMFPQTHHVECVALLRWVGASSAAGSAGLVLASASPRRRELMDGLGLGFEVAPADVPEDALPGEGPQDMVERLSRDKALKVAARMGEGFVVGADSTVVHLGEALGKPRDDDEARAMLRRLRGTVHHVCTGLTVVDAATGRLMTVSMTSQITLRDFSDGEIEASIAAGTPRDKAGAYAVQDTALRPAAGWDGCYYNIVGLPICRLLELLGELGWRAPLGWSLPEGAACGAGCPSFSAAASLSGEGLGLS